MPTLRKNILTCINLTNVALNYHLFSVFLGSGVVVVERLERSLQSLHHHYTTAHTWILGPLLGQPHIHCQLQQRTLRFLCSIQNNNNILVSACWKYASNNANSPLGYNIAYFRNSYGIDILPDVCVKKIIHPPQLDNEQHMVISELNMLLLAKGEMYNIDGFTKSNIDTFIKLIATD